MPHNLVTTPVFSVSSIPVPDEGEVITAIRANAGDGPVDPAFQILGNNDAYLHIVASELLTSSLVPRVSMQIQTGQAYLTPGLGTLWFWTDNTKTQVVSATFPNNSNVPNGAIGAAGWWYFYASANAGGQIFLNANPPDSEGVFCSTDVTLRYLGSTAVKPDGFGGWNYRPKRINHGRSIYSDEAQVIVNNITGTGAFITQSATSYIPPTASTGLFSCRVETQGSGATQPASILSMRNTGTAFAVQACATTQADTGIISFAIATVELDVGTNQSIDWQFAAPVGASSSIALINVSGYTE